MGAGSSRLKLAMFFYTQSDQVPSYLTLNCHQCIIFIFTINYSNFELSKPFLESVHSDDDTRQPDDHLDYDRDGRHKISGKGGRGELSLSPLHRIDWQLMKT